MSRVDMHCHPTAAQPGSPARAAPRRTRHLRLVPTSGRLRVADVALFYGERSGGIRTYLDAKAAWARSGGAIDHHLVVPGAHERHDDGRHELRSLRLTRSNGYRMPFGVGALKEALSSIRPDVVLLHDPFWSPRETTRFCHALGATVIMVHHERARARRPDQAAAAGFAQRHSWARAFEAELADLEAVLRPSRGRSRSTFAAVPSRSAR